MKSYYKIQEISKLYGICPDTIRYYEEQGLIHPKRSAHNYRLFTIRDIGALNIIRSLRELGMSTGQIRSYIHDRSISSTLDLYEQEKALIQEKILTLKAQYQDIERSFQDLGAALSLPINKPRLLTLAERPCFTLEGDSLPGSDIDFLLTKLQRQHEDIIKLIGNTDIGASYDLEAARQGRFDPVRSVFFLSKSPYQDSLIPAGVYGSIAYQGSYDQLEPAFFTLLSFLEEEGLIPAGNPLELYHIDTRETSRREEYVTELQILTKKKPSLYSNSKAPV